MPPHKTPTVIRSPSAWDGETPALPIAARGVWSITRLLFPIRFTSNTSLVKYSHDAPGAITKSAPVATANAVAMFRAARHWRVAKR
jgi:hypothetical protein